MSRDADLFESGDPAAPPRRNGELVFEAPWESRVFGVTIALHRRGLFDWDEFRSLLIDEIGSWENSGRDGAQWSYWRRWSSALERLLEARGICSDGNLRDIVDELRRRPSGHDHRER